MSCDTLASFIEKIGIPFFSTQMGKGVIDERNPLFLGNAALSANDYLHRAIEAADLIINVGHDVVEKPPFFMERKEQGSSSVAGAGRAGATAEQGSSSVAGAGRAGATDVIHVNYITAAIDPVYYPQQGVVGDIASSIERLADQIAP